MRSSRFDISVTGVLTPLYFPRLLSLHLCATSPSHPPLPPEHGSSLLLSTWTKQSTRNLFSYFMLNLGWRALQCACLPALLSSPPPLFSLPPFLFLFLSLSFPLLGSDLECCVSSTGIACLHCFLCMTLYAVSMLKKQKQKQKRRKHSAKNQTTCFGQNNNTNNIRGCILSVQLGITLLPLCAFGLCVAMFCQHETLCPLGDPRGGRAMCPGVWR